jgi:hypothetical protein
MSRTGRYADSVARQRLKRAVARSNRAYAAAQKPAGVGHGAPSSAPDPSVSRLRAADLKSRRLRAAKTAELRRRSGPVRLLLTLMFLCYAGLVGLYVISVVRDRLL